VADTQDSTAFGITDIAMNELRRENLRLKAEARNFSSEERRRWAFDQSLRVCSTFSSSMTYEDVKGISIDIERFAQTGSFAKGDAS
jgi:hypothetical protein